jgi:transcriptional regulator with XRE-family HTH domain
MMEMEQFLKEFGKTLKLTRKKMGLSQVTAAQNMRIDYRHYQNIEGGKINLRLDTLIKLVKFYNLDKAGRPFNLDACLDLLTGEPAEDQQHDHWSALYQYFVETGHAGHVVINGSTRTIETINEKLYKTLGYREADDLVNKPVDSILIPESASRFGDAISSGTTHDGSHPFIVTFRTQPPAYPVPMMAVIKLERTETGETHLHGIFFDRRTLDEEGHRLKEVLNGYQQFMALYPQLKAV